MQPRQAPSEAAVARRPRIDAADASPRRRRRRRGAAYQECGEVRPQLVQPPENGGGVLDGSEYGERSAAHAHQAASGPWNLWGRREDRVPTGCRHEKDGARSRKAGQDRRVQAQKGASRANLILVRCRTANCSLYASSHRAKRDMRSVFLPCRFSRACAKGGWGGGTATRASTRFVPRPLCSLPRLLWRFIGAAATQSGWLATITRRDL